MSTELGIIDQWLYETLTGDVTVAAAVGSRVYADVAPAGATYPCVVFSSMAPLDINGAGATRIATKDLYLVRVIGKGGGFAAIDGAANAVDSLLKKAYEELTGGVILSCLRDKPFQRSEVDSESGATFYSRGGLYRIMVRQS
jgi:hypothetical protein